MKPSACIIAKKRLIIFVEDLCVVPDLNYPHINPLTEGSNFYLNAENAMCCTVQSGLFLSADALFTWRQIHEKGGNG